MKDAIQLRPDTININVKVSTLHKMLSDNALHLSDLQCSNIEDKQRLQKMLLSIAGTGGADR